jgi:hypothetical protein
MSTPKITAYMMTSNGRRRSFRIGEFAVMVEPHEDDKAQAEFTQKLADAASEMTCEECGEEINWVDRNGKITCNHCGYVPSDDTNRRTYERVIYHLSREACVRLLENVSIQCYEHETVEVLREAVRVNVGDGTIGRDALEVES